VRYIWGMRNQTYPTDLTDRQWNCIQKLVPVGKPCGRPRTWDMRQVITASLYRVVSGVQGRRLPREYPQWQSVYSYFRCGRQDGTWQRLPDTVRAQVRQRVGRHKHPPAGCWDSPSVKTTPISGRRGYDSGQHVNGRQRPLLVETLGLLLVVVVSAASGSDPAGARLWFPAAWAGPARSCAAVGWTAPIAGLGWRGERRSVGCGYRQYGVPTPIRAWSCCRAAGWCNARGRAHPVPPFEQRL